MQLRVCLEGMLSTVCAPTKSCLHKCARSWGHVRWQLKAETPAISILQWLWGALTLFLDWEADAALAAAVTELAEVVPDAHACKKKGVAFSKKGKSREGSFRRLFGAAELAEQKAFV